MSKEPCKVEWRDRDWHKLIASIEEHTVIPIIGKDLLEVQPAEADQPVLLYQYIADKLAEEFSLESDVLSQSISLSDVVYRCLHEGADYFDIRYAILSILKTAEFPAPEPLRHLAEISDFDLFVSVTLDPLMGQALADVRFPGIPSPVEECAYDPKDPHKHEDVDFSRRTPERPILYHLMGKLSTGSDSVVITDEDLLEYICALQSENRVPKQLFNELQNNHLLLLGCSYSNWLARFFLRTAKRKRLSESRTVVEFVVDNRAQRDEDLVLFLQHFSRSTRVYCSGNAVAFTKELRDRWLEHNQHRTVAVNHAPVACLNGTPTQKMPDEMPEGAVFISYASEDLANVEALKNYLLQYDLPVWFDKDQLKSGDLYEQKITSYIHSCSLFVPVISNRTERRREGFFRREWKLAARRTENMDDRMPFIVPVCIDDTPEATARVPDKFLEAQWERCPAGAPNAQFGMRLRKLLECEAGVAGQPAASTSEL